jgi:triphosphatase
MNELELKFRVLPSQRAGLLKALGNRKLERLPLLARHVDTADGLLARHHMALRLRQEGGRRVQTLEGIGPHGFERLEHDVELGAVGPDAASMTVDPRRHEGSPVGDRLLALLETHGNPALREVHVTDVARIRRSVRHHDALVEWALDEGVVRAGTATAPISELELELKEGEPASLYAMALDWQGRHGLWLDAISKSERARLLARGQAFSAPVKAQPPRWDKKAARAMSGEQMLRTLAATCLSQILPNASEIAAGSLEAEHVHQLRVGLRRLRSALREMAGFAGALDPEWETPVRRVFAALGAVRDHEVFLDSVAPRLLHAGAPVADFADAVSVDEDEQALGGLVRGGPFQAALLQLMAFAYGGDPRPGPHEHAHSAALAVLCDRLTRMQRQVARDAKRFETMAFAQQHRVRKRLKRLRYVAAFLCPLYPQRDVAAWLKKVKPAQEALGRHVDLLTAAHRFAAQASADPRAWFAAGWLQAQTMDSTRESRKALERLARAEVFW